MKKIILFAGSFCFALMLSQLQAQSINNRTWKSYINDPINDTVTFHIQSDSSFVTNSAGDVMVRTHCTVSSDTLTLADYDGEHACMDVTGKYKISLTSDSFTLTLIEDPCEGRGQALHQKKWIEAGRK